MFAILLLSWLCYGDHIGYSPSSCVCHCGNYTGECWCDEFCYGYGDCCNDYLSECHLHRPSCRNNCGEQVGSCYCDQDCSWYNDCCRDIERYCTFGDESNESGDTVWPEGHDPSLCKKWLPAWFDDKSDWVIEYYKKYSDLESWYESPFYMYHYYGRSDSSEREYELHEWFDDADYWVIEYYLSNFANIDEWYESDIYKYYNWG